jgi:hypothetical protein
MRAVFIMVNMALRPLFAAPISQPSAPSKFITQVTEAWMPILCSMEPHRQRIALAHAAVLADLELGHDEQRDAFHASRRIGQAGQHQVHDVFGEVMFAGGDEDLGAADAETAIRIAARRGS